MTIIYHINTTSPNIKATWILFWIRQIRFQLFKPYFVPILNHPRNFFFIFFFNLNDLFIYLIFVFFLIVITNLFNHPIKKNLTLLNFYINLNLLCFHHNFIIVIVILLIILILNYKLLIHHLFILSVIYIYYQNKFLWTLHQNNYLFKTFKTIFSL